MLKLWKFFNGHKTEIAVVLSVVVSVLGRRGIEIPVWIFDVTDGLLGLGLAHKGVKMVGKKAVAVLVAVCLTGCATGEQSAPQIPLAPVYQAGSPVVVIVAPDLVPTVTSPGEKKSPTIIEVSRTGHDARGDVGAEGEQGNTPTNDVKTDANVSGLPK